MLHVALGEAVSALTHEAEVPTRGLRSTPYASHVANIWDGSFMNNLRRQSY